MRPPSKRIPPLGQGKRSARQRVLAQWCGVDLSPLEIERAPKPGRSAGDVLPQVLKDLKMEMRRADLEIIKVWNATIDPVVTAHAHPANLHKGTLFVKVDSDVWKYEIIRYHRKEILKRMQYGFGLEKIKKVHFSVG